MTERRGSRFLRTVRRAAAASAAQQARTISIRRAAIVSACVAAFAACLIVADPDTTLGALCARASQLIEHVVQQNSSVDAVLKNVKLLLGYAGLVVAGELAARLTSLLGVCCSYSANLLKMRNANPIVAVLEGGLLLRAIRLTWDVLAKSLVEYSFDAREAALYAEHFERHGLSPREFRALLDAGAQWRRWAPSVDEGKEGVAARGPPSLWVKPRSALTIEGRPTNQLILLTKGRCAVVHGGVHVASLEPGALVGENSFTRRISGSHSVIAKATVMPLGHVEYVAWPMSELARMLAASSYAKACLLTIIAAEQANAPHAIRTLSADLTPTECPIRAPTCTFGCRPFSRNAWRHAYELLPSGRASAHSAGRTGETAASTPRRPVPGERGPAGSHCAASCCPVGGGACGLCSAVRGVGGDCRGFGAGARPLRVGMRSG